MDKIIADCENYFLQSRMIPQQSQIRACMEISLLDCVGTKFIHSLARLLLCGSRGSGKTSVAITVAKHLERSPKVFACKWSQSTTLDSGSNPNVRSHLY